MALRPTKIAIAGAALLLACVAGLVVVSLPLLPFQHQWARQRWQQRGLRHYEVDVSWASGWSFGHMQVEMRDNQIVRAVDLDSGQPLSQSRLFQTQHFASIDTLFELIDHQTRLSPNWRYQLARYNRLLGHWLDPCAAPLPRVRYDAQFGYPASVEYYDTPCIETDFNLSTVKITQFHPLP